jgi:hypothetical protein
MSMAASQQQNGPQICCATLIEYKSQFDKNSTSTKIVKNYTHIWNPWNFRNLLS